MSSDALDFYYIGTQAVINFFFLQGKTAKEILAILIETLVEHARSYATVKIWVAQIKHPDFSTWFVPRPGRLKTVTFPEFNELIMRQS